MCDSMSLNVTVMAGNDNIDSQLFTHMWRHQTEILSIICIFVINSCNELNLMNIDYLNTNSFHTTNSLTPS